MPCHMIKKSAITLVMACWFLTTQAGAAAIQADADSAQASVIAPIIGGTEAAAGEFPFVVQVRPNGDLCAGSLISDQWVVTAAHCVDEISDANNISVRAGSNFLSSGGQIINARRLITHPEFDNWTFDNDIALIEMESAFTIDLIAAVSWLGTNEGNLMPEGASLIVAGWGTTSFGGSSSENLLKVSVDMSYRENCVANSLYTGSEITENMICAGVPEGGRDACQGDSGGPLIVYDDGQPWLAGIVSWGEGCGLADYPGVYTRVAKYDRWIREQIGLAIEPLVPVPALPVSMLFIMTLALSLLAIRRATAA